MISYAIAMFFSVTFSMNNFTNIAIMMSFLFIQMPYIETNFGSYFTSQHSHNVILSRTIENWRKIHLVSDNSCNIVNL